jgi:hypothetical protein
MSEPNEPMVPAVSIETDDQYVLDFPILVGIILHNQTTDTDYLNLPQLGPLFPVDSVAGDLQPLNGGRVIRIGPSFTFRDRDMFRAHLMAGESNRVLIDLSMFGHSFFPGKYRLQISLYEKSAVFRSSNAVNVELIEPTAVERSEASRLRHLGLPNNTSDTGSWQPFLTNNWNTVSVSAAINGRALNQLKLYLALHRAAFSPEPISRFPIQTLRDIQGVAAAEARLLEYEVITARGEESEIKAVRIGLLRTWPELKIRLRQIDNGEGDLRTLRSGYGAERHPPRPSGRQPYSLPGDQ